MLCPLCRSDTKVIAVVENKKEKETYRKRRCTNQKCWHHFYTVEFEAILNKQFMKEWNDNDRN